VVHSPRRHRLPQRDASNRSFPCWEPPEGFGESTHLASVEPEPVGGVSAVACAARTGPPHVPCGRLRTFSTWSIQSSCLWSRRCSEGHDGSLHPHSCPWHVPLPALCSTADNKELWKSWAASSTVRSGPRLRSLDLEPSDVHDILKHGMHAQKKGFLFFFSERLKRSPVAWRRPGFYHVHIDYNAVDLSRVQEDFPFHPVERATLNELCQCRMQTCLTLSFSLA